MPRTAPILAHPCIREEIRYKSSPRCEAEDDWNPNAEDDWNPKQAALELSPNHFRNEQVEHKRDRRVARCGEVFALFSNERPKPMCGNVRNPC